MQRPDIFKGRSLGATSDLTLLARLKPGFIASLESVTYKTRTKRVLDALHASRATAHEYAPARLLSDSIERVAVIQSVRVAVFDDTDQVLLSVSFDGPWESYIRVLWQKVGALLDLIFCGTEDYVTASDHSFAEWLVWARRVQTETGFFFGPPNATARDLVFLRRLEQKRARDGADEAFDVSFALPTAEAEALTLGAVPPFEPPDTAASEAEVQALRKAHDTAAQLARAEVGHERVRAGLQGMVALYRLADLHVPGTHDGAVLHRAAQSLLVEFVQVLKAQPALVPALKTRFKRPLEWLLPDPPAPDPIARPERPGTVGVPAEVRTDVQGGILRSYGQLTHGAALLLRFTGPAQAAAFLQKQRPLLTRDAQAGDDNPATHDVTPEAPVRNLAFTAQGLLALGMDDDDHALLPDEFRQGMKARAGLLGDVHHNHPRRWRLPRRLGAPEHVTVDLDTVHAVLQLRASAATPGQEAATDITDADHPLKQAVDDLLADDTVEVLAVEPLRRQYANPDTRVGIKEHFGFIDGGGNPDLLGLDPNPANRVHLGEVLLGHPNAADLPPDLRDPTLSDEFRRRQRWLANGTFLVVRKYRQHVDRLYAAAAQAAADTGLTPDEVLAKMMGRELGGAPLADPTADPPNRFDYLDDPHGAKCPLHAHVRRANPRDTTPATAPGGRLPRIVRRSMSFGPAYNHRNPCAPVNAEPRGLLFMAYNASLGEQFEVIQRWIAGGNSTGSFSGQSCPVLGVPEPGQRRAYRFNAGGKLVRMALDGSDEVFGDPSPFTELAWGCYLFVPSFTALQRLIDQALAVAARAVVPVPWDTRRGVAAIARLAQAPGSAPVTAWKAALEDADAVDRLGSASIWAAVRDHHDGVLRTPYGVLVGTRQLAMQVLMHERDRYSLVGQMERMRQCFGEIYLGMDDTENSRYRELATRTNAAIMALDPAESFRIAHAAAKKKLAAIAIGANALADVFHGTRFESSFDGREIVDEVLADLAEAWFGLSDGTFFRRGGVDWSWKPGDAPSYPGHFTAISRYMFQPHPGATVADYARKYGQGLLEAMTAFFATGPHGVLTDAIAQDPAYQGKNDLVARTMVGVLMGFIPTVAGAILNTLRDWLTDGTFWHLRAEVQRLPAPLDFKAATALLRPPMNAALVARPMPPQLWRTAVATDVLGTGPHAVTVQPGDVVVIGVASCLQQGLVDGADNDSRLMFGGKRKDDAPHPTHACPGYHSAIGSLVGTLLAFLEVPQQLKSGATPLQLVLDGPVTPAAPPAAPGPVPHATPYPAP